MSSQPGNGETRVRPRFWQGQRFRRFVLLSVAVHATVGAIWGVPGYVRMREEQEQQRQAMLTLQRQQEAAEATLRQAAADALERTKREVAEATKKTFESVVKELPAKQKEKVWEKVSAKISPASEAFARALADRSHTEQDLRNIQADLNRQLVEETDAEVTISVTQMLAEDFLASVQQNVVPEAVRHYSGKVEQHVGNRLRGEGDRFINNTRNRTQEAMNRARERAERARGTLDRVREQVAAVPDAGRLGEAGRQIAEVARLLGEAAKQCEGVEGVEDVAAVAQDAMKSAGEMKAGIAAAQEQFKAKKMIEATATLAQVAMAETRLRPLTTRMAELAGRSNETADARAREAIGWARDSSLSKGIDAQFAEGFAKEAGPRMVGVLVSRFQKVLEGRSLKDEKLVEDVRERVKQILNRGIGEAKSYHEPGTRPLEDLARKLDAAGAGSSASLRNAFAEMGQKVVEKGIAEVMKDAGADGWLAERTNLPVNGMEDDVRYRLETMANNAREGRTLGMLDNIGSGGLTAMREGALSRAAMLEQMQATAAAGGPINGDMAATTQMADPTIAQVTEELAAEMQADFRFLMGGKLNEKAEGIWKDLRGRTASDLLGLAEALLDSGVSDQELEKRRLAFSDKFLGAMQGSLDASAAGDMSDALLKELNGQTGDRIAQRYQGLVRDSIGAALQRELWSAANQKRAGASADTRGLALALEGAKDGANKAAELADQTRGRLGKPSTQPADAAKAEVPLIDGIGNSLATTGQDLQQAAAKAGARPVEIVDGVKATVHALGQMKEATEKAEAAAKQGDAQAAGKELEAVRVAAAAVNKAADGVQGALGKEIDDEVARFAAAVRAAERGGDGGGIHGDVVGLFDQQFAGEMLPRLTETALEAYKRRLRDTGVNTEVDEKQLRAGIAAALKGKVGGAAAGDAAIGRIEEADFMRLAEKGKASDEATANVRAMAKGVIKDSAGRIGRDGGAYDEAGRAAGGLAADGAYGEVKGRVGQFASALRAGRGGVLAGEMEGEGDGGGAGGRRLGLMGIRGKWQGMMAGAAGAGGAGGAGNGMGRGMGLRPGRGIGRGTIVRFDEEQYAKLTAETKDRDKTAAQGEEWDRQGAMGEASRVADDQRHPAAIVLPATQPSAQTSNDQPYVPAFKSIKFMSIPYLNTPFAMDGNFQKWKDIPGFDLLPERGDGQGIEGLKIAEKIPAKMAWDATGLYVWVDVVDADNKLLMASTEGSFAIADVAEIWVDTLNTKERARARGAGQQFWVWPDGMAGHPEYTGGESSKDLNTNYIPTTFTMESLQRAVKKTEQGYALEFHLPMERLRDADMAAGKIVGFNMTVETGTKIHYYWSASKAVGTWGRPDTWGDILLAGSDGKLEIPAKLSWERSTGEEDKVLETFVVGEPLRIRVTDRDMNLGSDKRDKVSVSVRAGGEQEVAILEETGDDTGIFEGSIRTALSFGERVPGTLSVYEGEKVTITYIDQARANGARNAQLKFVVQAGAVVTGAGLQQASR